MSIIKIFILQVDIECYSPIKVAFNNNFSNGTSHLEDRVDSPSQKSAEEDKDEGLEPEPAYEEKEMIDEEVPVEQEPEAQEEEPQNAGNSSQPNIFLQMLQIELKVWNTEMLMTKRVKTVMHKVFCVTNALQITYRLYVNII